MTLYIQIQIFNRNLDDFSMDDFSYRMPTIVIPIIIAVNGVRCEKLTPFRVSEEY